MRLMEIMSVLLCSSRTSRKRIRLLRDLVETCDNLNQLVVFAIEITDVHRFFSVVDGRPRLRDGSVNIGGLRIVHV